MTGPLRGERLIAVRVGDDEPRLTGKVVYVGQRWLFYRDQKKANFFRVHGNGFALDDAVLRAIDGEVEEVHYKLDAQLYTVPFDLFVEAATHGYFNGRLQRILPLHLWERSDERYRLTYLPGKLTQVVHAPKLSEVKTVPVVAGKPNGALAQQPRLL